MRILAVIGALLIMTTAACAVSGGSAADDEPTTAETVSSSEPSQVTTEPPANSDDSTTTVEESDPSADGEIDVSADDDECDAGTDESVDFEFDAAGRSYRVRVYRPTLVHGHRAPAVLNWHGLGSTGVQQALLTSYEALAESEGFIVVHPTGVTTPGDARPSWELDQFDDPMRDDVAMAGALIDRLVAELCVDERRVYSTGMSNGGFFTSRLVCELSDRIAAAVSVAGVSHYEDCRPKRPVPFMAYHGTADEIVPFDGGPSTLAPAGSPPETVEFFNQVMPEEFAEFAADFGCEPEPAVTEISPEVVRSDYRACDDDIGVAFVEIIDGGHTWPGSLLAVLAGGALGRTTTDVSATQDGWRFMSQFSLD